MKHSLGEKEWRALLAVEEVALTYKELSTADKSSDNELVRRHLDTAHGLATFVLEQCTEELGEKHPQTWSAQGILARIITVMGDLEDAEETFNTLLPAAACQFGDHIHVLSYQHHWSKIHIQQS